MRALALILVAMILPELASAADLDGTLEGIFSANTPTRLLSQQDFYTKWRNDPSAVESLVNKSLDNMGNIAGVYDSLSILARTNANLVGTATKQKILDLAQGAQSNSEGTAKIASQVYEKFGGGALPGPGAIATVNSIFSPQLSDRLQGQTDFYNKWIGDIEALNLLVDTATKNITNVPGVYDALSLLERAEPPASQNGELRQKTLKLTEFAYANSSATAAVASRVHVKFGGGPLAAAAGRGTSQADQEVAKEVVASQQARPFDQFKSDTNGLTFEQVQSGITSKITKPEFDAVVANMNRHYQNLAVVATIQIPTPDGSSVRSFDCVPRNMQPSLQEKGHADTAGSGTMPPFAPTVQPKDAGMSSVSSDSNTAAVASPPIPAAPEVSITANASPSCPTGTVGIPRISVGEAIAQDAAQPKPILDENSLRRFSGINTVTPATPFAHRYAHAAQSVTNHGAVASLNVWSPRVVPGDMSLSQIWVVGIDVGSNNLQTVEAGWQVLSLWKTPFATTFIYSTDDNYVRTGCYVTQCSANNPPRAETFNLTTNKIIVGRPVPTNGANAVQMTRIFRDPNTGNWWVSIDDEWVGFYPKESFQGGTLSVSANYIDFGGETAGLMPTAEMGSGHFAEEGAGLAAYQRNILYYDDHDQPLTPTLNPVVTDIDCYSVSLDKPAAKADWGRYFYFGGPGTGHFRNNGAAPPVEACQRH